MPAPQAARARVTENGSGKKLADTLWPGATGTVYRLAVSGVERVKNPARKFDRARDRHRPAKLGTFDILHHEVIGADIVQYYP
jgi:hypothetical protein